MNHSQTPSSQNTFRKGMTLEQYMAETNFKDQPSASPPTTEENLYQSSKNVQIQRYNHKRHYRIDQIDQESVQDSRDYFKGIQERQTPTFQPQQPQESISLSRQDQSVPKNRANSVFMSTAITFKHNQENTHFRIKRMSQSPNTKKPSPPANNASITLYGAKFGALQKQKKQKVPQMLTFYGKLAQLPQQSIVRKSSIKESDLKQKLKKKQVYELHKALQFDHPRNFIHQNQHYPNLRVEGRRDQSLPRKHALF